MTKVTAYSAEGEKLSIESDEQSQPKNQDHERRD